jgi:5-methylcytosine-specific restriction enzyme A
MIVSAIRHAARVLMSLRREAKKRTDRSPKWRSVEKAFKESHPTCAACGGKRLLQIHHEKPFHLHPELELDPNNLITLCMGKFECHIRIGHGDNFQFYNPLVRRDASVVLAHPERREVVEHDAKIRRLVNHGDS